MANQYLNRDDAPFSAAVWGSIDQAVVQAAKGQLSARRILTVDGPYGLGLKSLPGRDAAAAEGTDGVALSVGAATPLVVIRKGFALAGRDVAAFEQSGVPMDLSEAARAAIACARQEDALLLQGSKEIGNEGLMTAKGTLSVKLKTWQEVGAAVDAVIDAVTKLDDAGFHGPYALALAPALYNLLFRRYPQGNQTELEHMRTVVTDGVVKAAALPAGGVLLATGRQYASIVLGQDLVTGFVGPSGGDYEFTVAETVALRLAAPRAVCVLK